MSTKTKPYTVASLMSSDDEGPMLVVWGDDPAKILEAAQEFAAHEEMVVTDTLESVRVRPIRTNPCNPVSCWDEGGHNAHYAYGGGRGSFMGAFVWIRHQTREERNTSRAIREDTDPHEH